MVQQQGQHKMCYAEICIYLHAHFYSLSQEQIYVNYKTRYYNIDTLIAQVQPQLTYSMMEKII